MKEKNFDEYKAFIINKKFNEFNYNTEKIKINIFIYYKYLLFLKLILSKGFLPSYFSK